jgi:ribosomal subunit interface protein
MRLELTGRHIEVTPTLRRLVDKKLARLDRLLNDSAVSAQAVLAREKKGYMAEITLHARGEKYLFGRGVSTGWAPALHAAVDRISQQALKVKGKRDARKKSGRGTKR